jgi:hypothetical protein
MNNLENIMKENKALFMDQEPASGHVKRFEKKLNKQNNRKKIVQLTYKISKVAAIGLLVLMSGLWAKNQFFVTDNQPMTLSAVGNDYKEIEMYYTSQISNKYQQLEESQLLSNEAYKDILLSEITEMDTIYLELQQELGANPNDERIVQAMIRHYHTKLQVINGILDRFQEIQNMNQQQSKQNEYENTSL